MHLTGMKYITLNTSPFPELAGPRESLEFSLARLCDERSSFSGMEGKRGRESQGRGKELSKVWNQEAKSIFIYMKYEQNISKRYKRLKIYLNCLMNWYTTAKKIAK